MKTLPYPSSKNVDPPPPQIAGLGELLWDMFPDHKRLGGAPANFAIHCQQMGASGNPVSCIGNDILGDQSIYALKELDVSTRYIKHAEGAPTGMVEVSLDQSGHPSYEIASESAWDYLEYTADLKNLSAEVDAVCFGTLGQRSPRSRAAIRAFVEGTSRQSLRILDVNLRQSYYSKAIIKHSLEMANVLKLSDEELPVISDFFQITGSPERQLRQLRSQFDLRLIAYTRGPDGSILMASDEQHDFSGKPCKVVDSVGAGDSFTAALCMGLLKQWPLNCINLFANEVAAFVCSQNGATPRLPDSLLGAIS